MAVQRLRTVAGTAASCPSSTIVIAKGCRRPLRGTSRSNASTNSNSNTSSSSSTGGSGNGCCSHCSSCGIGSNNSTSSSSTSKNNKSSNKKWSLARVVGSVGQAPVEGGACSGALAGKTPPLTEEDLEKCKGSKPRSISIQLTLTRGCILGLMALTYLALGGNLSACLPLSAFHLDPSTADDGSTVKTSWASFAALEPALSPQAILRGGNNNNNDDSKSKSNKKDLSSSNGNGNGGGVVVGGGGAVSPSLKAEQRNVNKEARRYALQARAARAAARAAAQSVERAGQAPQHSAPHTATARARRASAADQAVRRSVSAIAALNRPHDTVRATAAIAALPSPEEMAQQGSGSSTEEQQQQKQQKKSPPGSASSAPSVASKLQAAAAAQALRESNSQIQITAEYPGGANHNRQGLPLVPKPELLDSGLPSFATLSTAAGPSSSSTLLAKRRQLPPTRVASVPAPSRPVMAGSAGDNAVHPEDFMQEIAMAHA